MNSTFQSIRSARQHIGTGHPVPSGFLSVFLLAFVIAGGACSSGTIVPSGPAEGYDGDAKDMLQRVRTKHQTSLSSVRLEKDILNFELEQGRPPSNLVELVQTGYARELPRGGKGVVFDFNPTNGQILTFRASEALSDLGLERTEGSE
jgi:hypothetical protein